LDAKQLPVRPGSWLTLSFILRQAERPGTRHPAASELFRFKTVLTLQTGAAGGLRKARAAPFDFEVMYHEYFD